MNIIKATAELSDKLNGEIYRPGKDSYCLNEDGFLERIIRGYGGEIVETSLLIYLTEEDFMADDWEIGLIS